MMQYVIPTSLSIGTETSPVYAPESNSLQFSAATLIAPAFSTAIAKSTYGAPIPYSAASSPVT